MFDSHWIVYVILIAGFLVFVIFPIALVLIAFLERYYIHQFVPIDECLRPPEPSNYVLAMKDSAEKNDFTFHGTYIDHRGGIYQCTLDFWLSADNKILVIVAGGEIMKVAYKKTIFMSFMDDGAVLRTLDVFGDVDLSNIPENKTLMNADFDALYEIHLARLDERDALPFHPNHLLESLEEFERRKVQKLIDEGLAYYLNDDEDRGVWRYTVKGAIKVYATSYRSQLNQAKMQQGRVNVKRPGDK